MEHFTINGNLFLAFANYKSDIAGKYNTDSFIYKFNDSTRKFSPYQNISTNGGQGVEYFKILMNITLLLLMVTRELPTD